LHKYNNSRSWR